MKKKIRGCWGDCARRAPEHMTSSGKRQSWLRGEGPGPVGEGGETSVHTAAWEAIFSPACLPEFHVWAV